MKIEYTQGLKETNIGDILITNKGNKYALLKNDNLDSVYTVIVYDIERDFVHFKTRPKVFKVDECLEDEIITEIIPKSRIKIVIED